MLLAFVPSYAFAHGEQVLLFPLGTLAAIVTMLLIASLREGLNKSPEVC